MKKRLYTHFLVVGFLILGSIAHEVKKKRQCPECAKRELYEN